MNNELSKELKLYYRDIEDSLICGRKTRNKILSSIRDAVSDFINSNPNADIGTVKTHFGSPKEIANEYYSNSDSDEVKAEINIRKTILLCVLAVLLITVIIYTISMIMVTIRGVKDLTGYNVITISATYQSDTDVSDSDLK